MRPTVTIQLARTRSDFEGAYRLLQASREHWGLETPRSHGLWLLKQHALPSTNTIVALQAGQVVGAICLFGDSPFHLPVEERLNLRPFRESLDGRLAELSLPALSPAFPEGPDLQRALYHFALCFGASYCHYDGFITEAPIAWAMQFASSLHLESLYEAMGDRQMLFLDAREGRDFRRGMSGGFVAEYHFPEKRFFLVAHQTMPPAVLDYLFNERTRLFASLSDFDLRVLKNIYDYGDHAKALPARELGLPARKTPRYPRFPMSCEGFLMSSAGKRENVTVLDVSREGLKIRAAKPLQPGSSLALTLFVGVNRATEVIASTIWSDEESGIAGLEIRSGDENWQRLIEYLEGNFLQAA